MNAEQDRIQSAVVCDDPSRSGRPVDGILVLYFPPGETDIGTSDAPDVQDNHDLAQCLLSNITGRSRVSLPGGTDEHGVRLWELRVLPQLPKRRYPFWGKVVWAAIGTLLLAYAVGMVVLPLLLK